jgi:FkbM family methyltransferase
MISFAQNQEDVVLFRLTNLISKGIYVDVGASHPILENVTYALYLEGWRGVNIEPMPREAALLKELRPEDENLEVAVGREIGEINLYEAPLENRGATTYDVEAVNRYRSTGQVFTEFVTPMITLDSVLARFEPRTVHIVKIDVEGFERDTLLGANLKTHQPWVLVIEATKPNSPIDTSSEWEPLVLDAGYDLVLFDGLNKFYVRQDLPEVKELLKTPANVFDEWQSSQSISAVEYAVSLRAVLDAREIEVANSVEYAVSLRAVLDAREAELAEATTYLNSLKNTVDEKNSYIHALLESIERIDK